MDFLSLNDGRKELYQWDTGRLASVTLEDVNEVHFSNLKYGKPYDMSVEDGKVEIPPEVLQTGETIYCWAYVGTVSSGYTYTEQLFTVNKRPKPTDYVYTPTEIKSFENLAKEVKGIIPVEVENALEEAKASGDFKGDKGDPGKDGKSAYEYAIEGGYEGSEEKFAQDLGKIDDIGGGTGDVNTEYSNNTFSNALKGNKGGSAILISDVSPVEHTLKVKVSGADDLSAVKVKAFGANLLDIEGREIVAFGAASNTTQRNFTGKGIIKGYAYSNYYKPSEIISFEKIENGFSYSTRNKAYSIGIDVKVLPNTTYSIYFDGITSSNCQFGEYDKEGNYIGYQFSTLGSNGARKITTKENTAWLVINPQIAEKNETGICNNLFCCVGDFMGFEPYIEPTEYAVNADGTVEGVKSIYPTITLMTDTNGTVIDCEYNRDINKAFAELYNAIISVGGNI